MAFKNKNYHFFLKCIGHFLPYAFHTRRLCLRRRQRRRVGLFLVPPMCFCFVGLPFFPSASWPLSFLLFFLFLRPCLIHARMPDCDRAFVHGHTFLHSWGGPMTLVVGLQHGATFLSNLTLVLFVSFIEP